MLSVEELFATVISNLLWGLGIVAQAFVPALGRQLDLSQLGLHWAMQRGPAIGNYRK